MTLSLGIVSVATNVYLDYWKSQAASLDRNVSPELPITIHIFTDRTSEAIEFSKSLKNLKVVAHEIPPYRWPEATLYRYKIFNEHKSELTQDILMYLDADMLVHSTLSLSRLAPQGTAEATLVKHPGYFRPTGLRRIKLYWQYRKLLVSDTYSRIKLGGLGAWETNPKSAAFVSRASRRNYYCGGIWWAPNAIFRDLVSELDSRVNSDESAGLMAVWHDESHINWWGTQHAHASQNPSFCFSTSYPWLTHLEMVVQAVDKDSMTRS